MDGILQNLLILRAALRKAEREALDHGDDGLMESINTAQTAGTALYTLLLMGVKEYDPPDAEA